jgi:hypothetical protein
MNFLKKQKKRKKRKKMNKSKCRYKNKSYQFWRRRYLIKSKILVKFVKVSRNLFKASYPDIDFTPVVTWQEEVRIVR